jgi:aminodeoxyfutalosine synthase
MPARPSTAPRGTRLGRQELVALYQSGDFLAAGALADEARRDRHGRKAYFRVNRHLNYSNLCVRRGQCRFCAFSRAPGEPGAYELSPAELSAAAREAAASGATELHLVGGLHPDWPLAHYETLLGALREAAPQLHLTAFAAPEIAHFAARERLAVAEVLARLVAAGLGGLPGGGAEIFAPRVRQAICPGKLSAEAWLDVHRAAHRLGLPTNATLLYGHVEDAAAKVEHLLALRELQDETGGFQAFVPLRFQPEGTALGAELAARGDGALAPGAADLLELAVARLALDNFPHLKAYWVTLGPALAQLGLSFGADDLEGTVGEERIAHAAGAASPRGMSRAALVALIRDGGCEPVEVDARYRPVERSSQ